MEILYPQLGIGELKLVLPGISQRLSEAQQEGAHQQWLVWIAPPLMPYPPALQRFPFVVANSVYVTPHNEREWLWTVEQCLLSPACAVVLFWPANSLSYTHLRRYELAAQKGNTLGVCFRSSQVSASASPVFLRLRISPPQPSGYGRGVELSEKNRLQIQVIKAKQGGRQGVETWVSFHDEAYCESAHLCPG